MNVVARLISSRSRIAFWALAGVTLLASHDAVFLVQTGPGEALVRTLREAGHEYWGLASLALAFIGVAIALALLVRLVGLRRWADALGARHAPIQHRAYLARSLRYWAALFAVVAIGFAIQENVEHVVVHGHLLGAGVLIGPDYPLALPVIAAISLLSGLVAGTFSAVERDLLVQIAAAIRRALARAPRRIVRPSRILRLAAIPVLAGAGAERAPPHLLASPT